MNTLTTNFNKAYPEFSTSSFSGSCIVEEHENDGKDALQQLEILGIEGYRFPHELVEKTSSFADIAKTPVLQNQNHCGVLKLNCDRVVLFEWKGQKILLFCELKSTFDTEEIAHAKDQIVGSWVKIRSLLQTLQGFDLDMYKPVGLIVSFEPTQEQLNALSKNYDLKSAFAVNLSAERFRTMQAAKTNKYFHPLNVGTIDLFYLPVPGRQKTFSVDINSIIK